MVSKKASYLNKSKGVMLAERARIASNFVDRLIGLLKTPVLEKGEGLFIVPCNQIHMLGMKYAIDVVFVDKQGKVVGLTERIAPGQFSKAFFAAHACLELPAGLIAETGTEEGDMIETQLL